MTAGLPALGWLRQPEKLQRLARAGLLLFFVWLAGRFWHPYYGFTRFVQLDESDAAVMLPELRGAPVYVYHYAGGYDGAAYAQLAARPSARGPELAHALDSLPYRARRILLSWVAHLLAWGDPVRAVQVYAGLNLAVWFALAWVLGKIFPPVGWRNFAAWTGLLFSAGVLHSVRLALTDLAAFTLLAAAIWIAESGRRNLPATLLAAAGLVRETALLGAAGLWRGAWREDWRGNLTRLVLVVVPLGLWLAYLKFNSGPVAQGLGNFDWPVAGWVEKLSDSISQLRSEPDTWLAVTTLLAFAALTTQALYLLRHREPRNAWWRLGAVYSLLLAGLGTAVWTGHPGAATRILLPLGLAFNVLAVRRRAGAVWLLAGNATVFAGVLALWQVPQDAHELAAGRSERGGYVVQADGRWHAAEHGGGRTWAWCAQTGGLAVDCWPRENRPVTLRLDVRGFTPRPLEIRQAGRILWRGEVGVRLQTIALPAIAPENGRVQLELASPAAPVAESAAAGARPLGFAVYGVRLD